MSKRKDRQDDNFHVYSSDYIDYRPSSGRAKKAASLQQNVIKIVLIAVIIIICLHIISRIHNPYSLAKFSKSFEKIALDASALNSELDELTKQFANLMNDEKSPLDEKTLLKEIKEVKTNLKTATCHLKKASELLESGSNRVNLEIDKSQ